MNEAAAVGAALTRGDIDEALRLVVNEVRTSPTASAPRLALFQLAAITGDWQRARRQLETLAEIDSEAVLMVRVYSAAIAAEARREAVLAGRERPICLGTPPSWIALLAEALALEARGAAAAAGDLRQQALEAAQAVGGTINGERFAWIMDADIRFGPVLEVMVQGEYRWLPFSAVREVRAEPPNDHKDLVWSAVRVTLANGGEVAALVPVRYFGSESSTDATVRLARSTVWEDTAAGQRGLGQRVIATDVGDYPFLELRQLRLGSD